jgi:hypothetical protein
MQLAQTTHTHTNSLQGTPAFKLSAAANPRIAGATGKAAESFRRAAAASSSHRTDFTRLQSPRFALHRQGDIHRFGAGPTPTPQVACFLSALRSRLQRRKQSLTVAPRTAVRTPHPRPQPDAVARPAAGHHQVRFSPRPRTEYAVRARTRTRQDAAVRGSRAGRAYFHPHTAATICGCAPWSGRAVESEPGRREIPLDRSPSTDKVAQAIS